ncbi:ATPase [Bifidobacterium pseudolongum subsp. globosum]|uniref:AAA family ATPase n=1 Tax=Bifidobacterium pseudolongum TaxID=1694 RepID=UPI00102102C0|nr:AAA family ATPase [Bifidobacterium pseudolongum]RYP97890.1 ATPase [Bifidobacterium pseudolongum subsp. globosum]
MDLEQRDSNGFTRKDYATFKTLLRFFYAQCAYNFDAGGNGRVRKLPIQDLRNDRRTYDVGAHLRDSALGGIGDISIINRRRSHPGAPKLDNRVHVGRMGFEVSFHWRTSFHSARSEFIKLTDRVGIYLYPTATSGITSDEDGTSDKEFTDFFTWNDPDGFDAFYVGSFHGGGEDTNPSRYGTFKIAALNLENDEPTPELVRMLKVLSELAAAEGVSTDIEQGTEKDNRSSSLPQPHNWILFGAPGSGKSHHIEELLDDGDAASRRITLHPDYTYARFVGSYKPVMVAGNGAGIPERIAYRFVAGAFTKTLCDALNHPGRPHVLVIEELNRADPAGVFGDVFQLLDRDENGVSQYAIEASDEMRAYLRHALDDDARRLLDELVSTARADAPDGDAEGSCGRIVIPGNMYLWATMNSADQGVAALDTAFKRRWAFQYLSLDGKEITPGHFDAQTMLERWDKIRQGINELLRSQIRDIPEDRLLGAHFLSSADLADPDRFAHAFTSKVVMYLFEDAARYHRDAVFAPMPDGRYPYLSDLIRALDSSQGNLGIFTAPIMQPQKEDASQRPYVGESGYGPYGGEGMQLPFEWGDDR